MSWGLDLVAHGPPFLACGPPRSFSTVAQATLGSWRAEAGVWAGPQMTQAWSFSPGLCYTNGADRSVLRNASVRLTIFDEQIRASRIAARLIRDGTSDGLVIFEDRPNYWDAWNVEFYHLEKVTQRDFARVPAVAHPCARLCPRGWSMVIAGSVLRASCRCDIRDTIWGGALADVEEYHWGHDLEHALSLSPKAQTPSSVGTAHSSDGFWIDRLFL
ncbi:hypothetical protein B0H14DRAFT_2603137 [Mycena olivaceomarginata]|nr:hypothetical protein B0H14DRAFT_2603137 [Mycena olivaceomarginata]